MSKIELDEPRRVFQPGDIMTGRIRFPTPQTDIGSIGLVLQGRTMTKLLVGKQWAKGLNVIIIEKHEVGPGPNGDWRFSIPVPTTVQPAHNFSTERPGSLTTNWESSKPTGIFENTAGHKLPPSFKHATDSSLTVFDSSIEYTLSPEGATELSGLLRGEQTFLFQPATPSPEELSHLHETMTREAFHAHVKNHRLQTWLDPEGGFTSMKAMMKAFKSSSPFPDFQYTIHASLKRYACVGKPLEISLQLEPKVWSEEHSHPLPEVLLVGVKLRLTSQTHVRGATPFQNPKMEHKQLEWEHWCGGRGAFEASRGYEKTFVTKPLSRSTAPSFATYNIARSYTLTLHFETECGSEQQSYSRPLPITVYGVQRERAVDGGDEQIGNGLDRLVVQRNDAQLPAYKADPPSYEEAVSGPSK